jgi:zinc transporter ZupT
VSLGVATSLAVLFHELPQELADYGILLEAGFSAKAALLLNLLSSVSSIIGLCIALPIAQASEVASLWILAITAGGFMYIALAAMTPELMKKRGKLQTAAQLLSATLGFVVMILLAVYEEQLQTSLCIQ